MAIDPKLPIPVYFQLKTLLLEEILEGRYGLDGRLPTEHQLCEQHEISRTPVTRALSELATEGVVIRHRRRGTFVNPHWVHRNRGGPELRVILPEGPWEGLIRRAALEALGLDPPATWDELRAASRALARAGGRGSHPVVLPGGSKAGEATTYILLALLASNGAAVLEDGVVVLDGLGTESTWTQRAGRHVLPACCSSSPSSPRSQQRGPSRRVHLHRHRHRQPPLGPDAAAGLRWSRRRSGRVRDRRQVARRQLDVENNHPVWVMFRWGAGSYHRFRLPKSLRGRK